MKQYIAFILALTVLFAVTPASYAQDKTAQSSSTMKKEKTKVKKVVKTDAEWRKILTKEQYEVMRGADTECAFSGSFWDNHDKGVYRCAGCQTELFSSDTKFNSGTGWPSFYDVLQKANVTLIEDKSHGMVRTEVKCAVCDAHLGHVFNDGPKPTGVRYCINSVALKFEKNANLKSSASSGGNRK